MDKLTDEEYLILERALRYVLDYGDDEDNEWCVLSRVYDKLFRGGEEQ